MFQNVNFFLAFFLEIPRKSWYNNFCCRNLLFSLGAQSNAGGDFGYASPSAQGLKHVLTHNTHITHHTNEHTHLKRGKGIIDVTQT
ncbi:MAG TPA: hypothetical protein DD391_02165 [Clostridiales bacterium]|nr:hypothetical protein [Clostridiales bacterium]HBL81399.1 hypothetical protein [Clostridiales bacterium]